MNDWITGDCLCIGKTCLSNSNRVRVGLESYTRISSSVHLYTVHGEMHDSFHSLLSLLLGIYKAVRGSRKRPLFMNNWITGGVTSMLGADLYKYLSERVSASCALKAEVGIRLNDPSLRSLHGSLCRGIASGTFGALHG